jgi:hypothetical protein
MTWVTELIAGLLVAGALVLLGLGRISFDQALSIITLGIGLVAGKQMARMDKYLERRYSGLAVARKFRGKVSWVSVEEGKVVVYVLPEFFEAATIEAIARYASELFPGRSVEVAKGERVRLV